MLLPRVKIWNTRAEAKIFNRIDVESIGILAVAIYYMTIGCYYASYCRGYGVLPQFTDLNKFLIGMPGKCQEFSFFY